MILKRNLYIFCWLITVSVSGNSFDIPDSVIALPDSTKPAVITKIFTQDQFETSNTNYRTADTTLDHFQIYRNRYNLGNTGLAIAPLTFNMPSTKLGWNYQPNYFSEYLITADKVPYMNTRTPYTDLNFITGAKKESVSGFTHSQNINSKVNFVIGFRRTRADGYYSRQQTNHNSFFISSNYRSSDKRYMILGNFIFNNLKNSENGGLANDSSFEFVALRDRKLSSMNLTAAERRLRTRSVFLKQYIGLGKTSVQDTGTKKFHPSSYLVHTFSLSDNLMMYKDANPLSGYYRDVLYDSTRTIDSTYYSNMENELLWKLSDEIVNDKKLDFEFGVKHQLISCRQYVAQDTGKVYRVTNRNGVNFRDQNIIIKGALKYKLFKTIIVTLSGQYVVNGYNKEDANVVCFVKNNFKNDSTHFILLSAAIDHRRPDYFYMNYFSNHFQWVNDFFQVKTNSVSVIYNYKKWDLKIGVNAASIQNLIYIDAYKPKQEDQTLQVVKANISKLISFHHFNLMNTVVYQNSMEAEVLPLPQWVLEHSLYYGNSVFKHKLKFQLGVDVFYNSVYNAKSYNPALGQFYLLSTDKQIGNYVYADLFLNLKISKVKVFFKYEHINAGLNGFTYYYAPHNPFNDRLFKFGINWAFFD